MVKIRCSASDRIRVPARPAQHVHLDRSDLVYKVQSSGARQPSTQAIQLPAELACASI